MIWTLIIIFLIEIVYCAIGYLPKTFTDPYPRLLFEIFRMYENAIQFFKNLLPCSTLSETLVYRLYLRPFLLTWHGLTLIPAWISNHMSCEV